MKTVPNPTFTIPLGNGKNASAKDLLLMAVDMPPASGFDAATQRARNRVADVLEKTAEGQEISLEDADYTTAQEAVKAWRCNIRHRDVVKFYELFGL